MSRGRLPRRCAAAGPLRRAFVNPCTPTAALTRRPAQNVSGRKLVGLRYWNYTSETGENEWQFESRDADGMAQVQVEEKRLFWFTLYLMVRAHAHTLPAVTRAC